ncbi:ATP-binding protein [Thalassotalea psychrophila]|uniref:histidine kinase n=1 Tax=Thalassotalea psychrophila TaxID=3065647 RepID=A0ABY9TT53_9GAMM|nr:ATP-binding protein [Colwelliaceae bacterium SQ149]
MDAIFFIELTLLITSSTLAIIFYTAWRTMGKQKYSLIWTITFLVIVLQRIFNLNKVSFDSHTLYWMIVCSLSVLSVVLGTWGHILRSQTKFNLNYLFGSCFIAILMTFYFTKIEHHVGLSMSIYVFYNSVILFLCGMIILKQPKKTMPAEMGASASYILLALMQALAGTLALMQGENNHESLKEMYIMVNFVTLPAAFIAMGLFVVFMLSSDLSEKLSQLMAQKNSMLANVTHDLRTPLANIKMQLEALEDGALEHSEKSYNSLQNKLGNLNHMVGDLYQLSLVESGSLVLNKQDIIINSLMRESIESFQPLASKAQLSINYIDSTEEKVTVNADAGRLFQTFNNLLKNSIRYTDPHGKINVSMSADNDDVTIVFEDTSPGVLDKDLEHLFDRLYRAENSKNLAKSGSGLGLYIVNSIITAHGGTVSAGHSNLGGLSVIVKLPKVTF